ncbi:MULTISPECIES: hypothetical protein [Nostoc cyanobionts]|nr:MULTISPECIES: hypothetical protein [unclassified Nostoc]
MQLNTPSSILQTDGLTLTSRKFQITKVMSAIAITTFIAQQAEVLTLTR